MAFRLSDFKKTTRTVAGKRQLYPHQIRDDRHTASIGYAIAYYERMIGRRQGEFEAEALLEFFGDPRLARGLVACLARSYTWRSPSFDQAIGHDAAHLLRRAGLASSADCRARLYGLANGSYGGVILPEERAEALEQLCLILGEQPAYGHNHPPTCPESVPAQSRQRIWERVEETPVGSLSPEQFERVLTLDADEQRLLHKIGPTPTAQEIVAHYNYHSLETALCHAESLRVELGGPVWEILRSAHNLARRYRLRYEVGGTPRTLFDERIELTLYGGRDALGRWTRIGRRLARATLRLIAAHPGSLLAGEARVHLGTQALRLRLDERTFKVLGAAVYAEEPDREAWEADPAEAFQQAWTRAVASGRTRGWRIRRDPDPLIGNGALIVPDFALQRGPHRVALCLAANQVTLKALLDQFARLGPAARAMLLAPEPALGALKKKDAVLGYREHPGEAIPQLLLALDRVYPTRQAA